jgi:hypothetical protein
VIVAGEVVNVLTCTVTTTLRVAPTASVIKTVAVPDFGKPTTVTAEPEIEALTTLASELFTE